MPLNFGDNDDDTDTSTVEEGTEDFETDEGDAVEEVSVAPPVHASAKRVGKTTPSAPQSLPDWLVPPRTESFRLLRAAIDVIVDGLRSAVSTERAAFETKAVDLERALLKDPNTEAEYGKREVLFGLAYYKERMSQSDLTRPERFQATWNA